MNQVGRAAKLAQEYDPRWQWMQPRGVFARRS